MDYALSCLIAHPFLTERLHKVGGNLRPSWSQFDSTREKAIGSTTEVSKTNLTSDTHSIGIIRNDYSRFLWVMLEVNKNGKYQNRVLNHGEESDKT